MNLNEGKNHSLSKEEATFQNISRGYLIIISLSKDVPARRSFVINSPQSFICGFLFVSTPAYSVEKKASGARIALITLFLAMFSFVVSAPSIFGLKILQSLKYIIKLIKRKDEVVETREKGKENEGPKTTYVKICTSFSFSFALSYHSFPLMPLCFNHILCVFWTLSNLKIALFLFQRHQKNYFLR
jgi:hypothetical protein